MKNKKGVIKTIIAHVRHFLKKSYRDNIAALAGQSTFFLLLSVIPLLLFVFSLFSILTGGNLKVNYNTDALADPAAKKVANFLVGFIQDSIQQSNSGTTIVTAVVALWSAGKGLYNIAEGVSRVYELPKRSLWIFKRLFAMGYTIVLMVIFFVSLAVMIALSWFENYITELLGTDKSFNQIMLILLTIVMFLMETLVLTLALKLYLHNRLKNRKYRTVRALFPGMLAATAAIKLLTAGVIIYLRNFGGSSIYGSLSGVFVVMMWIYFMNYILLYGVQLNYIYRKQFSEFRLFGRRKKKKEEPSEAPTEQIDCTIESPTE